MSQLHLLVKNLLNNNIDFQEYVLLYSLYNKNIDIICDYHDVEPYTNYIISNLTQKQFICRIVQNENKISLEDLYSNNLRLTSKGELIFKEFVKSAPSNEKLIPYKVSWIEEYYDLFPKGIKSGGFYVRSSIQDCSNKMNKFIIDNPQFTKDIILEATKNYINDCKARNYDKMKLAPYFIIKDGTSMLSGYCEAYVQGINDNQDTYSNDNTFGIKV
jgi:hypothetical protein